MEEQIKAAGIECVGKELTGLLYELNPQLLAQRVFGKEPETKAVAVEAVPRPPVLCPGCPHRGFFYTMSKNKNFVVGGDIGCYTLGCAAPLNALDSVVCMGGGFTVAMGMSKAFEVSGRNEQEGFRCGGRLYLLPLRYDRCGMEIIYNKGNMIPVVLDNSITGMTGHQDNPGTGYTLQGDIAEAIRIEDVLKSMGFQNVIIVDPQDLKAMQKAVDDALASTVPAAIITRRALPAHQADQA